MIKNPNQTLLPLVPNSLKDKVILIIGATGCIGEQVTKLLCSQGAQTILVGRQVKALEKLYDEVEHLGPHTPALHAMNLMNIGIEDCQSLRTHIEQLFQRLDAVVFCSGKWGELTPIEHYKESTWLELIHLNLNVPFLLTKNLMPLLRQTQNSTVIFTQSPVANSVKAYNGAFNCAQAALNTLMGLLHQENSYTSMRFIGVNPESVNSNTRRKLYPADPTPSDVYEAADIAPLYAALLGPKGDQFKGQTVDASLHLAPMEPVCMP